MEHGGWILRQNLGAFVSLAGALLGAPADDHDLLAIETGLAGTDHDADRWFEYVLAGKREVWFRLALCRDGDVMMVRVSSTTSVEAVRGLFVSAQEYVLARLGAIGPGG